MKSRTPIERIFILAFLVVAAATALLFSAAANAQGSPETSLKVAWFPVAHTEPLFVAIDKGFFDKHGVHVEPVTLQGGGPRQVEAALAGDIDGGISGGVPTAFAALKKVPIKLVVTLGTNRLGVKAAGMVVPNDSKIHKVADLKGKTVALYCRNCMTHALTLRAITAAGLQPSDINIVTMGGAAMLPALLNHSIDAGYIYEPNLTQVIAKGCRPVIYEDQIFPGMDSGGWFFTDKAIASKKKAIQGFVDGMRDAFKFINDHPVEAKKILAKKLGVESDLAAKMGGLEFNLSGAVDTDSLEKQVKMLVSLKMMPQAAEALDMKTMVDTQFLRGK